MSDADPQIQALIEVFARNQPWAKRGGYQTTLSPGNEQQFQGWLYKNKIPFDTKYPPDQSMQDYDMRGFWQSMVKGQAARDAETMHFPDTFKTPYHRTFSNQSRYATPDAPRWVGRKLVDKDGNVIADEEGQ